MHRLADPDQIRRWVAGDFGIELNEVAPVGDGGDAAAQLWRARTATGDTYAVKLTTGGSAAGLLLPALLAGSGVPGVGAPVCSRTAGLWSDRAAGRLSVTPWLSDRRALGGGMTPEHWMSLGALLSQVHGTRLSGPVVTALPRDIQHPDAEVAAAEALDRRLRPGTPAAGDGPADPIAEAVTRLWRRGRDRVHAVMSRADALGLVLRSRPAEPVVCHGDPHLGNVLLGGGDRVWLIDFDDAVVAPAERDLMFFRGGVLAFAPVRSAEHEAFFVGYGRVEIDPDRLAYYRCVRALQDLVDPVGQAVDVGGCPAPDRAIALKIAEGVLSATGLVELALSD